MYFCTWFGQMRPKPRDKGRGWEAFPGNWYYVPKRPMATFYVRNVVPPGHQGDEQMSGRYKANDNGCVEVRVPEHIKDFMNLGYPIWDGVTQFILPMWEPMGNALPYNLVKREGLIWPDSPEYDRKILEALQNRR